MPTLWIHGFDAANEVPFGAPLFTDSISVAGAATTSAALSVPSGQNVMLRVRLFTDTDCHVSWDGADATTADAPLGAENPEYFGIETGQTISCIQRS